MSTNSTPPGWHPDPSNPSAAVRWWDGVAWTQHVQAVAPAPMPVAMPAPMPVARPGTAPAWASGTAAGYPATMPQAPAGFAKRNQLSLVAVAVVAAYILLALVVHVVLLGIVPVVLAIRAVNRKEQLAPAAVVAAVVAIGVALVALG